MVRTVGTCRCVVTVGGLGGGVGRTVGGIMNSLVAGTGNRMKWTTVPP